ncbi:MAG TPA: glutathione S-transferase family protein [Candidatus Limnocylindria bacterium]|nr:glutathione S-transferase family protein [Candidatus Limnocylindria bacterium]
MSRLYRFYASEYSYFSAKPRPALRWKQVPFEEILPTPQAYRDVIRPRTGLSQIPVVLTPEDEVWHDSSVILDELERRFPARPLYPATPVQRMAGYAVELYTDEFLMLPGLHYRWSFPESARKAVSDFIASSGDAETAKQLAENIQTFAKLIGVLPETIPAIEAHTLELVDLLEAHLGAHPFALGGRPSLADCALIGPFYAHWYLDAVPGRLLRERAPRICHWIERMNHPDSRDDGAWATGDAIPPTFASIVALAGRDGVPGVLDAARAFETWADEHAPVAGHLPRAVGMHRTSLRGVGFERLTTPYTLWMVQRVRDAYRDLDAAARAAVDRAFAGSGFEAVFAYEPRWRVRRDPCRLRLEPAQSAQSTR